MSLSLVTEATTVKCGGKGQAFVKPGPDLRFVAAARQRAQSLAMGEQVDPRFRDVFAAIHAEETGNGDWAKRALADVTPLLYGALQGKPPFRVRIDCGKCKSKRGSHCHSAFCTTNPKDMDKAKASRKRVYKPLKVLADQCMTERFVSCRRPVATSP